MTTNRYRHGYLEGTARSSSTPANLLDSHFDVLITCPSWDKRSVCIAKCEKLHSTQGIAVLFDDRGQTGVRDTHDSIVTEYCRSHSDEYRELKGSSQHIENLWRDLAGLLDTCHTQIGQPLRIACDLSAVSRYCAVALLGHAFNTGIAKNVTYFYSEGQYPEEQREVDKHEMFTIGRWDTIAIPGFEGTYDPGKQRLYLVSVGFEGSKTLRAVNRAEPDRVEVLFPKPGICPEYEKRTEENNRELLEQYRISSAQVVNARASDAISAWQALEDAKLECSNSENIYYICCGTKPHAIALALRAMVLKRPAVLYNKPDSHKETTTRPAGHYWEFSIDDLTAIP